MQADGHLYHTTQNRGKMAIEIGAIDAHILNQFKDLVTCNSYIRERTRDTNFISGHTSVSWTVHDIGFRNAINAAGVPYGAKSKLIAPPEQPHSVPDYWRGIIDADGSLGITGQGFPFCSLVTSSHALANGFCNLIEQHCGYRPTTRPNKRDGVYNIMIIKESAQTLIKYLYQGSYIGLNRKRTSAQSAMEWVRPVGTKTKAEQLWSENQKTYALSHSIDETIAFTRRTRVAVEAMVRKLKRQKI
jgi:hypothetical protein